MNRAQAEAAIGSHVSAWTAVNGQYVGTLVEVIPRRPWRGVVKITGVLEAASVVDRVPRKGFRPGELIEVGGQSIKPTTEQGISYLEAMERSLAQIKKWVEEAEQNTNRSKDLWWAKPASELMRKQIELEKQGKLKEVRMARNLKDISEDIHKVARQLNTDQTIRNERDLFKLYGVRDAKQLDRAVYKDTECGAWVRIEGRQVNVGTIVEGSDAEFREKLTFPFTLKEWEEAITSLEERADETWRFVNNLRR